MALQPQGEPAADPLLDDMEEQQTVSMEHDGIGRRRATKQTCRIILNLLNTSTGTSTVAIPFVVLALGTVPALFLSILQGVLGIFANHILSSEAHKAKVGTYQGLMKQELGTAMAAVCTASVVMNGVGKLVVWLMILTDVILGDNHYRGLVPEILRWQGMFDKRAWYISHRAVWPFILALGAIPAVSLRSLDRMAWVSSLGDVSVLFMAIASVVLSIIASHKGIACPLGLWPSPQAVGSSGAFALLNYIAIAPVLLSIVFNQHMILGVSEQLKPYRQTRMDLASTCAAVLVILSKLIFGIANVLIFGLHTKSDVLLNYQQNALQKGLLPPKAAIVLSSTIRGAFLVNGIVSFPLYLHPVESNIWSYRQTGDQSSQDSQNSTARFAVTNYVVLAVSATIAAFLTDVKKPLALIGATAIGFLSYLAPAALVLFKRGGWGLWARVLAWGMVLLSILYVIAGSISVFV
jgi:amino acid permease